MNIIYNLFIGLYGTAIGIASSFNPKAKLFADGRKDWAVKMSQQVNPNDKIIWVHCSSLGEFEQGRPVMEKIKTEFTTHKLAVSFFSPSGYEVRKDYKGADYIFYLPVDTKKNSKKLIQLLHPEILILVKYEYWYNLLNRLRKSKIPVIVISAVIKEDSLFFKSIGSWFRKIIGSISHFFVQDEDSKNLLNSIQIDNVTISGDTRFDRVREILDSKPRLEFVEKFKGNSKLIVVGSSWPDDEEILVRFINEEFPKGWKLIFAPHNINPKQIVQLSEKINQKTSIYTKSNSTEISESDVLIVDTVGMLTKIYAYSDISYVGGGFTKTGVHNTLEPAVFGVPVIFGPNYQLYSEAIDLIENGGAVKFGDYHELKQELKQLINDEMLRTERGKICYKYIQSKPNSTKLIMEWLKNKLT